MKKAEIKKKYFEWLAHKVKLYSRKSNRDYWLLCAVLHKTEFTWVIPLDENRANDGKDLRLQFMEEMRIDGLSSLNGPCSVFEMLIALMDRFEFHMPDSDDKDRPSVWFWEMIYNLGLGIYTDDVYVEADDREDIDLILDNFLSRTYAKDGTGGLFPLRNPEKNQQKVEIWYQLSAYLLENHCEDYI